MPEEEDYPTDSIDERADIDHEELQWALTSIRDILDDKGCGDYIQLARIRDVLDKTGY